MICKLQKLNKSQEFQGSILNILSSGYLILFFCFIWILKNTLTDGKRNIFMHYSPMNSISPVNMAATEACHRMDMPIQANLDEPEW